MKHVDNPDFPRGTECVSNTGAHVTVTTWEAFEKRYKDELERARRSGKKSLTQWHRFIPVVDENGVVNGWYPESLTIISKPDVIEINEPEIENTIEI